MAWIPPGQRVQRDALLTLAAEQDNVVSRGQLLRFGIDDRDVRRHTAGGRWQLSHHNAVLLHTGEPTRRQRWWAAVIETSPRAVLVGATATEAGGLQGYGSTTIQVGVPPGANPGRPPGVVVHELRRLKAADIHPALRPPRTRFPVAVRDHARWSRGADRAVAVVAAAVQQRLLLIPDLRQAMGGMQRYRHRHIVELAVADIEGGSHSLSEIDAVRLCRRASLPVPDRQAVRLDGAGRRRWLDLDWSAYGVSAEIDGGLHMLVRNYNADMLRQNELVIPVGHTVLRFAAMDLRLHPDVFGDQIRRALCNRGLRLAA